MKPVSEPSAADGIDFARVEPNGKQLSGIMISNAS